jgi:hypothetical protein
MSRDESLPGDAMSHFVIPPKGAGDQSDLISQESPGFRVSLGITLLARNDGFVELRRDLH